MPDQNKKLDPRCELCDGLASRPVCRLIYDGTSGLRPPRVHRRYPARQVIFHEGDPSIYVYYLYSGAVKLTKAGEGERHVVLRILGSGDVFGYRAVLSNEDYAATATAIQDCVICAIPGEVFLDGVRTRSDLSEHFIKLLCREMRESEESWLHNTQDSALKNTMRVLQRLANASGEVVTGGRGHSQSLQRSEIAELIGVSNETFSRLLRKLADRGLLRTKRDIITLNKSLKSNQ